PINEQVEEDVSVEKFKIPVGFMPAKLLVGVRAQTSQDGAQNPKPVHFRVQAPATLPNKVRMNLSGCFVIANTWGNLATERIEAELKSIHCVSRDKNTLIEGEVFGYLADTDGQRDMHG
ncbi:conjugal transfer protein TraB, partial [Vibrio anguillarum]